MMTGEEAYKIYNHDPEQLRESWFEANPTEPFQNILTDICGCSLCMIEVKDMILIL